MFVETGKPIPYAGGHVHLFQVDDVMIETELESECGGDGDPVALPSSLHLRRRDGAQWFRPDHERSVQGQAHAHG